MKYSIFILLFFNIFGSNAQNIQLHYDFGEGRQYLTSTVEMFKLDKWGNTFFFIDMDYNGSKMDSENATGIGLAYLEIAREIKMWKAPIAIHLEYNGGLSANKNVRTFGTAILIGPSYTFLSKDFSSSLTIMALYKNIRNTLNNQPNNFQFTMVWTKNFMKNKITFNGFLDYWKENHLVFTKNGSPIASDYVFLCEPQLWYNLNKNVSLGGEVELSNDFAGGAGFFARPTIAAKWNF
ncbi:DUF5020 family protein [Flavobacterium sp. RSSA_27]|uniref:DUF5020 family protein n=1 Tax=Flavobacterium sp. RSSA_27 TaxID=3447667 RepID=UPI003F3CC2F0